MSSDELWTCKQCSMVKAGSDRPDYCPVCHADAGIPGVPDPLFVKVAT